MYVSNVEKPSFVPMTFLSMKEFTVEKNLTRVSIVENLSPIIAAGTVMKGFTLERNPMCAHSVGTPFHALHRSGGMKEFTLEKKSYKCNQCDKAFACHSHLHLHKITYWRETLQL